MNANNETELFVGDKVQVEGGVVIVETVGSKSAEGSWVGKHDAKLKTVANPYPKHLVLERGCVREVPRRGGLTNAQAATITHGVKPKRLPPHMALLEPGDWLVYQGKPSTVLSVTDRTAVVGHDDGAEFKDKRLVNTTVFESFESGGKNRKTVRLDAEQRAANLKDFLARRKSPPAGGNEQSDATQEESEADMSRKAKAKAKGKAGQTRKDFIWSQLDGSRTKREIAADVVERFGGKFEDELKRVSDAPFYMRKAGLKPAWKEIDKSSPEWRKGNDKACAK